MRFIVLHIFICVLSFGVFAQQNGKTTSAQNGAAPEVKPARDTDKEAFEKASALEEPLARIEAFEAFLTEYPQSEFRPQVFDFLTSARAAAADLKLREGETTEAVRLFRIAIEQSPNPSSDDLFSKVLVNIPTYLFLRNQREAAFEMADLLEVRAGENHRQLLRLATFYVGIKYATGVRKLAEKAIAIDPSDPVSYQTLALAHRLGFNLKGAVDAYSEALKVSPDSVMIKQGLAEMKRAQGSFEESEALFREIIEADSSFERARTGLILCLFDRGKRPEAEALLLKEIDDNKGSALLLAGTAYWYAVNDESDLALEYGEAAIEVDKADPWAYVAMARAYMKKGDPMSAERYLLTAAGYSLSSTLSFEIALARSSSGFYQEAAEILRSRFFVENGKLVTELDGRIGVEADNLSDLIALERKSDIFEPAANYDVDRDRELAALLLFEDTLAREGASDEEVETAVAKFTSINDRMQTHRRLYAASRLLNAGRLPETAGRLTLDAVPGIESSLDILVPAGAVMADQLYETRKAAAKDGRYLVTPKVERSTLEKIMRGRTEELIARSKLATGKDAEAEVHLKRAISVLPKESAWWQSSLWLLGGIYEKRGEDKEALEQYAASYMSGDVAFEKRVAIEIVYRRLHGSIEGLEDFLSNRKTVTPDAASMFTKKAPVESNPETVKVSSTGETKVVQPEDEIEIGKLPADPIDVRGEFPAEPSTASSNKVLAEDVDLTLADKIPVAETIKLKPVETVKPADPDVKAATGPDKPLINPTVENPEKTEPDVKKTPDLADAAKPDKTEDAVTPDEENLPEPADEDLTPKENTTPATSNAAREAELIDLGATRPRIVSPEKMKELQAGSTAPQACSVVLSQERVSIFANGGSFGIVVGVKDYYEAYVLRAISSSVENVTITHEPEIGSLDGRAFFVIKSVSDKIGEYQVTFETPCGSRSITVEVH